MVQSRMVPKILIVDDNPENLFALDKLLETLDTEVIKASSGNEALSSVLYNEFALIILDVQMPDMDGYEVAEILKSDEKTDTIPIIFLTAIDRNELKEVKGYDKGAVDFIFKPLNDQILISKVKIFLELYKIKSGLETLVVERTRELSRSNEKLNEQINKNEETNRALGRARSYLLNVINSISSSLIGIDSKGLIIDMNRTAETISGVLSEKAKGRSIKEVFPFYRGLNETVTESMTSGLPVEKTRVPVYRGDSAYVNNFYVYPLSGNGSRGAVARVDDVTERARIDEMMIQSEKMLSIGGLAAGMAHEINNPLAGILQNIQVLKNRMVKDLPVNTKTAKECGTTMESIKAYMERRELIKIIHTIVESGRRAAQVVENMLNFSQKSQGLARKENLCDLMDKTLELARNDYDLKKKFDFRKIKIRRSYQADMPQVVCQRSKIQQVMLNILTNGTHAMAGMDPTKERNYQFTIEIEEKMGMASLLLEDNGIGMDEAVRKRIFEPFFTTKKNGTGLGLSISYFIITEDHGGTMEVEATPGKGSRFIIRLPI